MGVARRCGICDVDWPYASGYSTCALCGEPTKVTPGAHPMPLSAAEKKKAEIAAELEAAERRRRKLAEFEEWYWREWAPNQPDHDEIGRQQARELIAMEEAVKSADGNERRYGGAGPALTDVDE